VQRHDKGAAANHAVAGNAFFNILVRDDIKGELDLTVK